MSNYQIIGIFLGAFFFFGKCQQKNSLAQDETSLVNELNLLEEISMPHEKKTSKGKFLDIPEEPRTSDPANPIIVLNILAARSDVRDIETSDLFSEIKYIPIKFPGTTDSITAKFGEYDFLITPNNIIASHYTKGIFQFDRNGIFIRQLVKNDFYFTAVPNYDSYMISSEDMKQFVGSSGQVHAIGDRIFYQYHNNPDSHGAMIRYDANPESLSPIMVNSNENPVGVPRGNEVFSIHVDDPKFSFISSIMPRNFIPINEEEWASTSSVMNSSVGHFLYTTNLNGDTLTKFKNHDPIVNYTGGTYRSLDSRGDHYSYQGQQHVRQSHNDTIYILSNVNQLTPKYVLDFGEKGIQSTMEGINPQMSLTDKFIIQDFIECNSYLFITYTQNAPSPNAAKKKEVFYNACIYDKKTRELFHVYVDQPPFIPGGRGWPRSPKNYLANDHDSGPPFWPKKTNHDGFPFTWINGKDLKAKIENTVWKNELFSIENMREDDYLLMIAQ